jgi:TonB family protein
MSSPQYNIRKATISLGMEPKRKKSIFIKALKATFYTVVIILLCLRILNYFNPAETNHKKSLQKSSQTINKEIEKTKPKSKKTLTKESESSTNFEPYMKKLQKEIKSNWKPPKLEESKRVVTSFIVHSDGRVSDIKVVNPSKNGPKAKAAALKAVQSSKIDPLPIGAGENVAIEFTFDYNIVRK